MGLGCNGECNGVCECGYTPDSAWFVVEHAPGKLGQVRVELDRAGYAAFVPLQTIRERVRSAVRRRGPCAQRTGGYMRWINRDVPLFPGYVFVALPAQDALIPLCDVRYVSAVLSGAGELPVEMPAALMAAIFARHKARADLVGEKSPFRPGDAVRITSGAFQGFEGEYHRADGRDSVQILIDILGAIRGVSISTENVVNK